MKVAVLGAGAIGGIMAIGLGREYIQEELARRVRCSREPSFAPNTERKVTAWHIKR